MLSKQSQSYWSFVKLFKYKLFKLFYSSDLSKFVNLIKYGTLPRPQYALGLILAAVQARSLGYKKISVIEFGCWNLEGLIDMENYIDDIKKIIDIEIKVYGFELGTGHPHYDDPKNRIATEKTGHYKFDAKENLDKLKYTKVIWGDVENTVEKFFNENDIKNNPIGFVAFDLGLYTPTKNALKLFDYDPENFLPKVNIYQDNIYCVLKNEGESLAFKEFNDRNSFDKQISEIGEFAEQLSVYWYKWIFLGKRMHQLSNQKHKMFNKPTDDILSILLSKGHTNRISGESIPK